MALSAPKRTRQDDFELYTPPQLNPATLTATEREKIKQIRNSPTVVLGIAAVKRVSDNSLLPVYFKVDRTFPKTQLTVFKTFSLMTDREIGFASVQEDEPRIANFSSSFSAANPYAYYGEHSGEAQYTGPFLSLKALAQSDPQFKNVGSTLFKAILQFYKIKYSYHLKLQSSLKNATLFFKLGCIPSESKDLALQSKIATDAKSGIISSDASNFIYMVINDLGRQLWQKEIESHPIRFPDDV